jgi:hypothetical protein
MFKTNHTKLVSLALAACLTVSLGCLFGPDKDKAPPPANDFKPLTDKENVIYNLVLSYDRADIAHYNELLHADYLWYMQPRDIMMVHDTFWTRAQDLSATENLFQSTRGQNSDPQWNVTKLQLDIKSASWSLYPDSIPGCPYPCTDCWQTTREYYVTVGTEGGDTFIANDLVLFVVVPVEAGGKTLYKLWRAEDIEK